MYWGVLQSEERSLLWKTKFILFHHRQFCRKKNRKCKVPCSSFKVLNRAAWWGNGMYYSWLLEIIVLASHFFVIFVVFCTKLTCFYIWRTTFVNRSDSAALQFFIKCCFGTRFQLYHTNCSSCDFDIAISIIYWLIVQP